MKPENCKQVFLLFFSPWLLTLEWRHTPIFHSFLFFSSLCTDIDECRTHPGKCHVNAICNNTHRSHVCTCKPGYTGDGHNCTGTVDNLESLPILLEFNNNFFIVVVAFWYHGEPRLTICNVGKGSYPQLVLCFES